MNYRKLIWGSTKSHFHVFHIFAFCRLFYLNQRPRKSHFCLLQPYRLRKYLLNKCSNMREICTEMIKTLYQSGAEKNTFLYFYIFTLCSLTDGQNVYRIYAHISDECAQKKLDFLILIRSRENRVSIFIHCFFLQPYKQTDGQNIYRINAHSSDKSGLSRKQYSRN